MICSRDLEILQGTGSSGGSLDKDADSGPHGEAAVSDLFQGEVSGRGRGLAEVERIEAEVSWSAVTRLSALRDGESGENCRIRESDTSMDAKKDSYKRNKRSTMPRKMKEAKMGPGLRSKTVQNTSTWFLPVGCIDIQFSLLWNKFKKCI